MVDGPNCPSLKRSVGHSMTTFDGCLKHKAITCVNISQNIPLSSAVKKVEGWEEPLRQSVVFVDTNFVPPTFNRTNSESSAINTTPSDKNTVRHWWDSKVDWKIEKFQRSVSFSCANRYWSGQEAHFRVDHISSCCIYIIEARPESCWRRHLVQNWGPAFRTHDLRFCQCR